MSPSICKLSRRVEQWREAPGEGRSRTNEARPSSGLRPPSPEGEGCGKRKRDAFARRQSSMRRLALASIALVFLAALKPSSQLTERQRALHALNRLAFGPRPGDIDKVMAVGVAEWINQQLHPETIPDRAVEARLQNLPTLRMTNADIMHEFYAPLVQARRERETDQIKDAQKKSREVVEDLVSQRIIRATESDRQLNEVMVDFWFNHFNVFVGKGIDRFMLTSYERDTIRPHVWGRFEDLLMATAKSPAMLFYLDNARSVAAPENRPKFAGAGDLALRRRPSGQPLPMMATDEEMMMNAQRRQAQ